MGGNPAPLSVSCSRDAIPRRDSRDRRRMQGPATLTFDHANRHTYSGKTSASPRVAKYLAVVGVLTCRGIC